MDVCMTIEETVLISGLIRGLVRQCYDLVLQQKPIPRTTVEVLRVANWRAARYGLDGELLNPLTNRLLPAKELISTFLDFIRPALEAEGDWQRISGGVAQLLQYGNGAMRQRAIYQQTRSFHDLMNYIVAQTRTF